MIKGLDIGKIKIPKIDNKKVNHNKKSKSSEFNIFSIEEEQSIFFNQENAPYEDNN